MVARIFSPWIVRLERAGCPFHHVEEAQSDKRSYERRSHITCLWLQPGNPAFRPGGPDCAVGTRRYDVETFIAERLPRSASIQGVIRPRWSTCEKCVLAGQIAYDGSIAARSGRRIGIRIRFRGAPGFSAIGGKGDIGAGIIRRLIITPHHDADCRISKRDRKNARRSPGGNRRFDDIP